MMEWWNKQIRYQPLQSRAQKTSFILSLDPNPTPGPKTVEKKYQNIVEPTTKQMVRYSRLFSAT